MENRIMEYHYEEAEKGDGNTMVKEYNDRKPFTVVILIVMFLTRLTLLCAICYSVAVVVMNIFNLFIK